MILHLSVASRLALVPTQHTAQWVPGAVSLGVKQQGHEADHSAPSSAEIKSGGAVPPLPIRLHGMLNKLGTGTTIPLPYLLVYI
jgi:hypothetical protein